MQRTAISFNQSQHTKAQKETYTKTFILKHEKLHKLKQRFFYFFGGMNNKNENKLLVSALIKFFLARLLSNILIEEGDCVKMI